MSMEDKHIYASKMKEWRRRSPLRKWRERLGLDVNAAAYHLGLSFSTYQKWDYGNGHPLLKTEEGSGRLYALVNVAVPDQTFKGKILREPKEWDDRMLAETGISLNKFMQWYHRRPKP